MRIVLDGFYVIGQKLRIEGRRVVLPKIGSVRFRAGRLPEGRIVGGAVTRVANDWFATLQCEVEIDVRPVEPKAETVIGVDLGLASHMATSDGEAIDPDGDGVVEVALEFEDAIRRPAAVVSGFPHRGIGCDGERHRRGRP